MADKYTVQQGLLIQRFCRNMVEAAINAQCSLRKVNKEHRDIHWQESMRYYTNVISGYKWGIGIARQRTDSNESTIRQTV